MVSYPAARFVSAYYKASEVLVQSHGIDLESMSIVVPMFVNLHIRDFDLS
jgi:uridine phosphorylase